MDSSVDHVARAMGIATMVHAGQVDKLGDPYLHHVLRVYKRVAHDDTYGCVALLHDVLEDSGGIVGHPMLRDLFPNTVSWSVLALTRMAGDSYLKDYIPRIKSRGAWDPAVVVKIRDLEDNLSRIPQLELVNHQMAHRLRSRYTKALEILTQ